MLLICIVNRLFAGCEIHTFDCYWEEGLGSGTAKLVPPSDSTRIHFHPWCISGPGGDTGVEGAQLSETDSRLQLEFKSFDDVRHIPSYKARERCWGSDGISLD